MISIEKFLTYFLKVIFSGLLVFLIASLKFPIDKSILFIFIVFMAIWALSFPLVGQFNVRIILKKKYYSYRSIVVQAISFQPAPGTSLISELNSKAVSVDNIEYMLLMTCNLAHGCDYYDKKLKKQLEHVKIDMYGSGKCPKHGENITLYTTTDSLEEHENIIKTKQGRFFIYYEPSHKLVGKNKDRDELKKGAYLFELKDKDDQDALEEAIKDKLEKKLIKEAA